MEVWGVSIHGGTPIARWFIMDIHGESQLKVDGLGVPLFQETSIHGIIHVDLFIEMMEGL